jgi:hypothetical protein
MSCLISYNSIPETSLSCHTLYNTFVKFVSPFRLAESLINKNSVT